MSVGTIEKEVLEMVRLPKKQMVVAKRTSFDAAHFLPNYPGRCAQMHGHHWVVEIAVKGPVQEDGMVIDFTFLKLMLSDVEKTLDHSLLNDTVTCPTAENICLWIETVWNKWASDGGMGDVKLDHITCWETEDSYALLEL